MEPLQGYLFDISKLADEIKNQPLTDEELVILAYSIGTLHSTLLERIEPGLSKKRRFSYSQKKSEEKPVCECGGKQKPKYTLEYPTKRMVCQQCYRKKKKT